MKQLKLLMLPFMLVGISACGGGGSIDTSKVKFSFWHTFGDIPETSLQEKVNKFVELVKANEGVDVEVEMAYQGGYNDMPQKMTTAFATGDTPTIAVAYADHIADYMNYEGDEPGKYVVNFDKFLKDESLTFGTDKYLGDTEKESDMVKSYMDEGRQMQREGTYLIPYMKSTEIMIYNLTAVKKAIRYADPAVVDINVPDDKVKEYMQTITWKQLLALAKAAKDHASEISSVLKYPIYYDSDSNLFITQLYQNGIGYSSIGSDHKGKIDFEEAEQLAKAKTIVSGLRQAHDDGLLTTKGVENEYSSNNFKEAKTIFSIGSTGGTGYTIPDAGAFEIAFAKVPTMGEDEEKVSYVSQGPSLAFFRNPAVSDAENELKLKYAWKLVKYITSKNVNVSLCVTGSQGYTPVRNSCFTTEVYSDFIEEGESFAEAALVTQNDIKGRYFNTAVFPGSATLRKEVGALVTSVLTSNKVTLDDAFSVAINNTKKDIK